jgi:hypothetical protein
MYSPCGSDFLSRALPGPQLIPILPQMPATISWLRRYFSILRTVSHSGGESIVRLDKRLI